MSDAQLYSAASKIILIAMGSQKISQGQGRKALIVWNADQDPLAHWCGVEAVVSLVERATLSNDRQSVGGENHG